MRGSANQFDRCGKPERKATAKHASNEGYGKQKYFDSWAQTSPDDEVGATYYRPTRKPSGFTEGTLTAMSPEVWR